MKWVISLVVVVKLLCLIYPACADVPYSMQLVPVNENYHQYAGGIDDDATDYENNEMNMDLQGEEIDQIGNYLAKLLVMPWNHRGMPLIYVEEKNANTYNEPNYDYDTSGIANAPIKRSRYFRMYPFKRQNIKQGYDNENIYMCQPTKEEVFKLLMALQDARQRNTKGSTINFCKRKRPTSAIFANIRFLS